MKPRTTASRRQSVLTFDRHCELPYGVSSHASDGLGVLRGPVVARLESRHSEPTPSSIRRYPLDSVDGRGVVVETEQLGKTHRWQQVQAGPLPLGTRLAVLGRRRPCIVGWSRSGCGPTAWRCFQSASAGRPDDGQRYGAVGGRSESALLDDNRFVVDIGCRSR